MGYFTDERRNRLNSLVETLKKSKEEFIFVKYDKFVFEIQMRYGLSEQKAKEYLKIAMGLLDASIDTNGEIIFAKNG